MVNLSDLEAELAKGRIYEATLITDDGAHLEGMCDHGNGSITVDPKVSIVSVLLHELIHRKHPDWSETRVRRAEKNAMRQLSQQDVQVWYRRYRRAVRKRRPVDAIDYSGYGG
jgi:hypothetical protein